MRGFIKTTRQIAEEALFRSQSSGGGGGGITQLTSDVLAGPGSGSQAATVLRIHGATVPVAGALTIGNVLQVTGIAALAYGPVNLAGGPDFVTGTLPAGNLPSLAGDVTGSITSNSVVRITGNAGEADVIDSTDLNFLTTGSAVSTNARVNFVGDVNQTWLGFHFNTVDYPIIGNIGSGTIKFGDATVPALEVNAFFTEIIGDGQIITLQGSGISASATNWTFNSTPTFFDANSNVQVGGVTTTAGSGVGVLGLSNATANPSTNPVGGGVLYASGGALFWRNPAGVVTPIAP